MTTRLVRASSLHADQTTHHEFLPVSSPLDVSARRLTCDLCRARAGSVEDAERPAWLCWRCARSYR